MNILNLFRKFTMSPPNMEPGQFSMPLRAKMNQLNAEIEERVRRSNPAFYQSSSKGNAKTTGFSDLPVEIRKKIWLLTLPGPRVLHVVHHPKTIQTCRHAPSTQSLMPVVTPASYGLHHPAILQVNYESRSIALSKLTKICDVYWNLEIDAPYFEIKDDDDDAVCLLAEMRKAGELKQFKNIAVDWKLWMWELSTRTMEFRVTFGGRFEGYEHPLKVLRHLPNIKKCSFVYTEHTLQSDVVQPYQAWYLGPLTDETTNFTVGKMVPQTNWDDSLEQTIGKIEDTIENRQAQAMTGRPGGDLKLELMAIHGRERGSVPGTGLKRPTQGWQMDWFG
ncbi:uncharacterized protein PAC_11817 [Phialocephala subalpina]|uniref:2EXR domain-containing protein n=1 Tax=Phialocephala subalpina TaxID=576137 RepID=A0A1L7XA67_9HELO|nr:uncharacterized protein PAC_11817 [Phialocephala subalpina]